MKNKFKVGDMVECVDGKEDDLLSNKLKEGGLYKVREVDATFEGYPIIRIEDSWKAYYSKRFKLSNQKPMIRDTKGRFTGKKNVVNVPTEAESISAFIKDEVDRQVKAMMALIRNEVKTETPKEVVQSGFFEPKEGEKYYFVDPFGDIGESTSGYEPVLFDDRVLVGNCFRTEQDARDHLEYLKAIRRIKKYIYENGMSFSPNWEDSTEDKFYLKYEFSILEWNIDGSGYNNRLPIIPFLRSHRDCVRVASTCSSDLDIIKNYSISHNF